MNEHVDALVWCMGAHVRRHVGPIAHVLHSPGAELLHLDIFHVPPTPRRRCHTLFTCGMSQRPMCPPDVAGDCRFAELYLSLPPDWRVGPGRATEDAIWPLRELGELARLPHVSESWIWTGHTVGAPDPEARITPGAGFTGWILGPHLSLGHDPCVFHFRDETVMIHSVMPIYKEELALARRCGPEALFRLLSLHGVSDVIDIARSNVFPQRSGSPSRRGRRHRGR